MKLSQLEQWKNQAFEEKVDWHLAQGHFANAEPLGAYEAGFKQGWTNLVSLLKVHGILQVEI